MSRLSGVGWLVRLALRRDRIRLPIWVGGLAALLAVQAAGNAQEFASAINRAAAATLVSTNPALRMLRGGASDASLGALVVSDAYWILAVVTALMSALTVVRHTRENEESGRGELIGAGPVGTHADLAAAVVVSVAANAVLGVLVAGALAVNGLPVAGSLAAGASIGAVGVAFAGLAAVAVQLSESARTAAGLSAGAVGLAYLLRGAGDALGRIERDGIRVTSAWPSWLSPIGWGQQVRAFADDSWWVLVLPVSLFAVTVVAAALLRARRDFGHGLLPVRLGRATAASSLLSPIGLAWRLQRGLLIGWAVGMVAAGALFGSVGEQVADLADNPAFVQFLNRLGGPGRLTDAFFAAMMSLAGGVAAVYPVQALLRMRAEESEGRLEPVLATSVGRARWAMSHIGVAVVGAFGLLVLLGVSAGMADGQATGEIGARVGVLTRAALVQLPAIFVLAGFTVAVFGLLPHWAETLSWTGLVLALLLGPLGDILDLPQAIRDLSPFSHIPPVPVVEPTVAPLVALLIIAAGLSAAGLISFERRNLALPA